jgi:hypothetical protein
MNLVSVRQALKNRSLRVGDHIVVNQGVLQFGSPGIVAAILPSNFGQTVKVFWLETRKTEPVDQRTLSTLWCSRRQATFEEMMVWWATDTRFMSSTHQIMSHPVAKIVHEAGHRYTDLLIDTLKAMLEDREQYAEVIGAVYLLRRITDLKPWVDAKDGDVYAMARAWVENRERERRERAERRKLSETEFCGVYGTCRDCGSSVSHYTCNADLIAQRPQAAEWDWWAACDNTQCPNHVGEGIFQHRPDFEVRT